MASNVVFLNSDDKTNSERLTAQNASLLSIYNQNEANVREVQTLANNTQAQLSNLLSIYRRVRNSINNLTKATELLIDLEEQLYIGMRKGSRLISLTNSWVDPY